MHNYLMTMNMFKWSFEKSKSGDNFYNNRILKFAAHKKLFITPFASDNDDDSRLLRSHFVKSLSCA